MSPRKKPRKRTKKAGPLLPVVPSSPAPAAPAMKRSRTSKWRAGALIAIHLVIAAHIVHWLLAGSTVTPVEPSEAMAFSKAGMINAGLIFFAATILLTAIFGRFFCGWACHLVALQDLCRWLLAKAGIRPQPLRSRLLAWVPVVAFVYMFLWPVAYRLWIGDELGVQGREMTTEHFWATFPGWVVGALTFLVCGFASVYFLGAKGFCTYACPYGAIFSAAERLAPLRVRVSDACEGSAHCTATCSSNVRVHEEVATWGMVVDPGCMKCGDCISVCPNDALSFGFGRLPLAAAPRRDPSERRPGLAPSDELVVGLAFVIAFFSYRGLFGTLPFLFALGLAGVLAFLALLASRLIRRRDYAWRHRRLRIDGAFTLAGRLVIAALALVGLATLGAGTLRGAAALADRAYVATAGVRARLPDVSAPLPALTTTEGQAVRSARERWQAVERWSPLPWLGAASRLAALRYLEGDADGFRVDARRAIARGEQPYEISRLEARAFAEAGNLSAALATGERAIVLRPDLPEAFSSLGILLARGGALDAAAEVLARGRSSFPTHVDLLYNQGLVAALRGETGQAIADFSRVLDLAPDHTPALENLAGMLASAGRFDDSVALYRRALEVAPDDPALRVLLSRALVGAGRVEEARREVERALRSAPDDPAAREIQESLRPSGAPASPRRPDGVAPSYPMR